MNGKTSTGRWAPPLLLFLFSLALYWVTQYPGVGGRICPGDSAKFQFIGHVLGLPHGPGFPLYILLNKLFVSLPLPVPIWMKANLLSIVFGALDNVLVYLLCLRLWNDRLSAIAASSIAAVGLIHWSQATETEVYSLNAFFFLLVVLKLSDWCASGERRDLLWSLFPFALSFGNHLMTVTLIPAVLFAALWGHGREGRRIALSPRTILPALLFALLGALPYFWLYLRNRACAPIVEGFPSGMPLPEFIRYILGLRFSSMMFEKETSQVLGQGLPEIALHIYHQYGGLVLLTAVVGLPFLWRRSRTVTILLALVCAGLLALGLSYSIFDITVYLIPLYLLLALPVHASLATVRIKLQGDRVLTAVLLACCAGVIGWNGITHHRQLQSKTPDQMPLVPLLVELEKDAVYYYNQWENYSLLYSYYHFTAEAEHDGRNLRFRSHTKPLRDEGLPVHFTDQSLLARFNQQGGFLVGRQQPLSDTARFLTESAGPGDLVLLTCCEQPTNEAGSLAAALLPEVIDQGARYRDAVCLATAFTVPEAADGTTTVHLLAYGMEGGETPWPLRRSLSLPLEHEPRETDAGSAAPARITITVSCGPDIALITNGPFVIQVNPGGLGLLILDRDTGHVKASYCSASGRTMDLWKAIPLSLLGTVVQLDHLQPPGDHLPKLPPYDTRPLPIARNQHLRLPDPPPSADNPQILTLSLRAAHAWPVERQTCSFTMNGMNLGTYSINRGWNSLCFLMAPAAPGEGHPDSEPGLQLEFGTNTTAGKPNEMLPPEMRERLRDLGVDELLIESAGRWCGDWASIFINGIEQSTNAPGLNVVALTPGLGGGSPGQRTDAFDLERDPGAGARFGEFIDALPDSSVVLVAARGDITTHHRPPVGAALNRIGGSADLSSMMQPSYALLGLKRTVPQPQPELVALLAPCRIGPLFTGQDKTGRPEGISHPYWLSLESLFLVNPDTPR